ncbi:hypothetical protein ACHQM5_004110 [Ranunculus cassubicifolius]
MGSNMQRQWILEFLLRQPVEDRELLPLISALSFSVHDHGVARTLLLRRITSVIDNDLISEGILESLELIEELNHQDGILISESMKAAYCAVARSCIVKNLKENPEYSDAVDRIWRNRILAMEEREVHLISDWSKDLKTEIEDAMRNVGVLHSLSVEDMEKDALNAVKLFLKDTTDQMGPSFLEVAEKTLLDEGENVQPLVDTAALNNHDRAEEGSSAHDSRNKLDENNKMVSGNSLSKVDTTSTLGIPCVTKNRVNPELPPESREVEDMGIELCREPTPPEHALETVNRIGDEVRDSSKSSLEGNFREARRFHFDAVGQGTEVSHENMSGGTCSEIDVPCSVERHEITTKKCNLVSTPEFKRVQQALKSSVLELHEAVEDPLPDALEIAASIARELANNFQSSENQNDMNVDRSDHSTDFENGQAKEVNSKPSAAVSRPSILERNNTARTYEWDEDEDGDSSTEDSRKRLHLPSPQNIRLSPLRKQVTRKTSIMGRRIKKRWSSFEESTLIDAVAEYGRGNWKIMLNAYREIFDGRTEGDLKDKWRNLNK